MLNQEARLALSIQKSGRLAKESDTLLRACRLNFESYDGNGRLFTDVNNFPLRLFYDRDDDIAVGVEGGDANLGIVGQNMVTESKAKVVELMKLGFGRCKLVVAAPPTIPCLDDLKGRRVVTSYPNSTEQYFGEKQIPISLTVRSGGVEGYVTRGYDAIVDLTATGSTLRTYNLVELDTILESESVLIADPSLKEVKGSERIVRDLIRRILSVERAKKSTYIALDAPSSRVDLIADVIPGVVSPSVSPLKRKDWVAVSAVVPSEELYQISDRLQDLGAEGIVELDMSRIIPDKDDVEVLTIMQRLYG